MRPVGWLTLFSDSKSEEILEAILQEVRMQIGIDFREYNRNTLKRRLARRMALAACNHLEEYLDFLKTTPSEGIALAQEFTIKVSRFFRDKEVFEFLKERILPGLFRQAKRDLGLIRIWSIGCARGEEPYSLAILIQELKEALLLDEIVCRIFATDIDQKALDSARKGVFGPEALKDVSPEIIEKYFIPLSGPKPLFQVRPEIQKMVDFLHHDVTSPQTTSPPPGIYHEYQLILCRYLLIYCSQTLKGRVLKKLYRALAPEGFLVLGKAESVCPELGDFFELIDKEAQIYRKRGQNEG